MFEPICSDAMAPFCVSDAYQAAVELDYGYAAALPGERTPDPIVVERLGVEIVRAFPHVGAPDGPRPYRRPICRDDVCFNVNASCRADGLECVWQQDFGSARASGFLMIRARSPENMEAAKANIWIVVNDVTVPLTDPDLAPVARN